MKEMQPDEFAPDESDLSGATGIFGVVKSPAAGAPELKMVPEEAIVSASPESQTRKITTREVVFKAADHASFEDTDALRRILDSSPTPSAGTGGGESFTQKFAASPAAPPSVPRPSVPVTSQNVGFTQLFQSFEGHTAVPASGVAAPPPVSSNAPVAPVAVQEGQAKPAGDAVFSQPVSMPALVREILHEVDLVSTFPSNAPGSGGYPSAPEVRSQPVGSFTQLFQTLAKPGGPMVPTAVRPHVTPPPDDPGSFTKLFSSLGSQPHAPMTQADSFPPLNSSSQPPRSGLGATPPADAYPAPGYPEPVYRESIPSEAVFSSPPPASSPAVEGGGDMTRLLRRLDSEFYEKAATPLKAEALPIASPFLDVGRAAGSPDGATVAFRIPELNAGNFRAAPAGPVANAGPSAMTSILNASAIRESLRKGGGPATAPLAPLADSAGAPAAGGGGGFPAMPGYPPMPPMLSMQMPPAQAQPMLPPQMQIPPMPQMQMPKAEVPVANGGGKSWVPILLMVIIVLLVGILLAVVLLMKK